MKPGARLQASIELLGFVWADKAPPNLVLKDYFRRRRYIGGKDRRVITKKVYDILRRRARLKWWIESSNLNLKPSPRLCLILDLALVDGMKAEQIMSLFSGDQYCPAELNVSEQNFANRYVGQALNHRDMPRPIAFEYPMWMDCRLLSLWGERFEEEIAGFNQSAPVDLRVNTLKVTRREAQSVLFNEGITSNPTPISPLGLRVNGHQRLERSTAFQGGFVEVQDEGSQLLSLLVGAKPGMTVVDFCAGAGGKTLALAAGMAKNGTLSGHLYACDVSAVRMKKMRDRIQRAGAFGIKLQAIKFANDEWVTDNCMCADRVLADVPCTGTGRWRRDSNLRWRYLPIDLESFRGQQQAIMTVAASLVKPGGRMIYTTCSFLEEENERQVVWFLSEHKNFASLSMNKVWREAFRLNQPPEMGLGLRLTPSLTGTDGFFCAVVERLY